MSIKDITDQIRSKLTDEAMSGVSGLLTQIDREAQDIISDLHSANNESKERKLKIRELKQEIEDSGDNKADYERKVTELNEEITRLKGIESEHTSFVETMNKNNKAKWDNIYETHLKVNDGDTRFDKINPVLHNFVIENPTPDQITANLKMFDVLEPTGVFGSVEKDFNGKKPGGKAPSSNPFDMYNGDPGSLRDMREAMRISREDPELAKKLRATAKTIKE